MECASCEEQRQRVTAEMDKNHQLTLQAIDKDETIRALQAEVQMIGARFRDMLWQRNALHEIVMSETRTNRYRQITNGQ